MFNHSNVRKSGWLDRSLRWLVVTPEMHRVHRSVIREEVNSNLGLPVLACSTDDRSLQPS